MKRRVTKNEEIRILKGKINELNKSFNNMEHSYINKCWTLLEDYNKVLGEKYHLINKIAELEKKNGKKVK